MSYNWLYQLFGCFGVPNPYRVIIGGGSKFLSVRRECDRANLSRVCSERAHEDFPVFVSQIITVLLSEALAIFVPSGEKQTELTQL
jgi:hypothetical protein